MTAEFYWGIGVGFIVCPLICAAALWGLLKADLRKQRLSMDLQDEPSALDSGTPLSSA